MARTAVPGRLTWQVGEVKRNEAETPRVRSLSLTVPGWPGHLAGQHLDIRLTAEDGYQAVRSYSIASPPEAASIELTIERLENGEVSPYLTDEVRPGDPLELRGPIGGYFVWEVMQDGPLFLVAAGSGIAPLRAMILHRVAAGSDVPVRLLYSSRSFADVIYREELDRLAAEHQGIEVIHTLTRSQPPGWTGYGRRIDRAMLEATAWPAAMHPRIFVCGPTSFVETASKQLVALGHDPVSIKTERFGPTGG